MFAAVFFISFFNLLLRSFSFTILNIYGLKFIAIAVAAELGLYAAFKRCMGDLRYWLAIYGVGEWLATFLARSIVKLIADWTAVVQFRSAMDLGGCYWVATLVFTCTSAVVLSFTFSDQVEDYQGWDPSIIVNCTLLCSVGLLSSILALMLNIKREYVKTFFDLDTANMAIQYEFSRPEEDELKIAIFGNHERKWRKDKGDDVTKWVDENLPKWLEEEPDWFSAKLQNDIPDWAVTDKALLMKLRERSSASHTGRRRNSIFQ